jgi:hypothetical protein
MAVSWLCNARDRAFFPLKPPGQLAYTAIESPTVSPITQIILSARVSFQLIRASVFSRLRGRSFRFLGMAWEAAASASAGQSIRISRPQAAQTKSRVSLRTCLSWSACQSAVPPLQNQSIATAALGLGHRGSLVDGFAGSGQALPLAESPQLEKFRVHSNYQWPMLDGSFGFPGDFGAFF